MKSEKYFKGELAQSVIEYVLLVAICLIALLGSAAFIDNLKNYTFENHFSLIRSRITGDAYLPAIK